MAFFSNLINSITMKTANVFPYLVLVCTTLLFGSCTAFQDAQWTEGNDETTHLMRGNQLQVGGCAHHLNSPDYMGAMSGAFIFSMRIEFFAFCNKCGRNVRGRQ